MNTTWHAGLLVAALCVGCGSNTNYQGSSNLSGSDGGTETDDDVLACVQKSSDGADDDCVELGKPRKMKCASAQEVKAAEAQGCVQEDPDDYGVCCPTTVRGTKPSTTSTKLACREKADALDEDECGAFAGRPKKLDCSSETNVTSAIAAGCVRQKSTSTDVCCPLTVSGTKE